MEKRRRIVERKDNSGSPYYIIQEKILWWWRDMKLSKVLIDRNAFLAVDCYKFTNPEAAIRVLREYKVRKYIGETIYPTVEKDVILNTKKGTCYSELSVYGNFEMCCFRINQVFEVKENLKYQKVFYG